MQVLFVQKALPYYRLPFFECLHQQQDFDVSVAYGDLKAWAGLTGLQEVAFRTLSLSNLTVPVLCGFIYQRKWPDLLKVAKWDCLILEFNTRILSNYLLMYVAKHRNIPCILWGHGLGHSKLSLVKRLRYYLVEKCDALVTYTQGGSEPFLEQGTSPDKLFVAPNTLDTNHIQPSEVEEPRNLILYVGRLIREKRVDVLIKAFASISHQLPTSELVIIGDGPEREFLETLAKELNVSSRCRFTGYLLDEEKLSAFFSRAVVYVCPGYVGLGVVHSFAYGVPVIVQRDANHSPEIEYVHPGLNGLMLNQAAPEAFAAAIQTLFEDIQLQTRLRAGAGSTARRLSMARMVQGFAEAIRYVCGRHK